jgi:hypothetical protein
VPSGTGIQAGRRAEPFRPSSVLSSTAPALQPEETIVRNPLPFALALVNLPLAAVAADDPCRDDPPEIRQMVEQTTLDEVTLQKIESLMEEAATLCEEGKPQEAAVKYDNTRELIESDERTNGGGPSD